MPCKLSHSKNLHTKINHILQDKSIYNIPIYDSGYGQSDLQTHWVCVQKERGKILHFKKIDLEEGVLWRSILASLF